MILNTGTPRRVFINQPSENQPFHKYHGLVGIAIPETGSACDVYFTSGSIYSMRIPKLYLSFKFHDRDMRYYYK